MPHFTTTLHVRWSDCDANGHAANTAYSEYGTDTRVAYLASHGWTLEDFMKHRCGPVITREEIDYLRELRMGDEVKVDIALVGGSADESRWKIQHEFTRTRDGKVCARILLTGGWMDLDARRLRRPPEQLAETFRKIERSAAWEVLPDAGAKKG